MTTVRWFAIVSAPLLLLLTSCLPVNRSSSVSIPAPQPISSITVWHAWQGGDLKVLEDIKAKYQHDMGTNVELVQFETPSALLAKLATARVTSEGPDVFLGYHTWGKELLEQGIVNAYCLPDQCSECEGPNPPHWCRYASGDFSESMNDDFLMKVGLCEHDECPQCFGNTPPLWCRFAQKDFGIKLDMLQAAFATSFNDDVFPYGIPIWWEYVDLFANPKRFEERGLILPTTLEEAKQIMKQPGNVYYDPSFFTDTGLDRPLPESVDPDGDPIKASILVVSSDDLPNLQEKVGKLIRLPLKDYRPEILVHGAYMNAHTKMRRQALDFIYALTDEEAQFDLFKATGHLPAHGEVLKTLGLTNDLLQLGKGGLLASAKPK